MRRVYLYIVAILFVTSCESEIPFEYNSIESLHIIQANLILDEELSQAAVYISKSRDIDSVMAEEAVTDALVEITTPQGDIIPLLFDGDSLYVAQVAGLSLTPRQGDYTLEVRVGEDYYRAYSSLPPVAEIADPTFYWQDVMMGMGVLMMIARIDDEAGEDNYYRYSFGLPDGSLYRDGVISDSSMDGYTIELMSQYNPDESLGYYTMDDDMAGSLYKLAPGDLLTFSVEQIDSRPYNYLSTLGLSTSNPVCSFEGGCLGYFSVSMMTTLEVLFTADSVEEL